MLIHTYENGRRELACKKRLEEETSLPVGECYLLPIPTSRLFADGERSEKIWERVGDVSLSDSLFVGYGIPNEVKERLARRGGRIVDAAEDEIFLAQNAELTAKGALGKLITSLDRDPREVGFGIVGFGRIGSRLARLLLSVGGRVTVFSGKESTVISLCLVGLSARKSEPNADLDGVDILVNTAPTRVFDTTRAEFSGKMRVVELASGDNFPSVSVERYAAIPAESFPESAGRILAESVLRAFEEG